MNRGQPLASLNHPNICALYDVGPNYPVMELIEGESPKGPLPLATVIDYAKQLASALDAANHRQHKPGGGFIPDVSMPQKTAYVGNGGKAPAATDDLAADDADYADWGA